MTEVLFSYLIPDGSMWMTKKWTHNLLHYYKAGDQASSLDDLHFILKSEGGLPVLRTDMK